MAQIVSNHIWYPAAYPSTAYDLRQIVTWYPKPTDATKVLVRFVSDLANTVEFDAAAFETAKQNSLDNSG